jgi:uracil DNA glycosylase
MRSQVAKTNLELVSDVKLKRDVPGHVDSVAEMSFIVQEPRTVEISDLKVVEVGSDPSHSPDQMSGVASSMLLPAGSRK